MQQYRDGQVSLHSEIKQPGRNLFVSFWKKIGNKVVRFASILNIIVLQ
jgi:hypothetical protein